MSDGNALYPHEQEPVAADLDVWLDNVRKAASTGRRLSKQDIGTLLGLLAEQSIEIERLKGSMEPYQGLQDAHLKQLRSVFRHSANYGEEWAVRAVDIAVQRIENLETWNQNLRKERRELLEALRLKTEALERRVVGPVGHIHENTMETLVKVINENEP